LHARVFVVVTVLISGVACGSSTTPTSPSGPSGSTTVTTPAATPTPAPLTPAAIAGVWTLFTVDGAPLPVVISQFGDTKIELLSDMLMIVANGTSTERAQSRFTAGSRVETDTTVEDGTFTIEGSTIRFLGKSGQQRTGTFNGTLLTAIVEGKTWVFRKS
jgi:hypothetical protein